MRWGKLTRNVADLADPPKPRRVDRPMWDARQIRIFLQHVAGDRLRAAWVLMVSTGMRRGEVLGLRWQDVDLDAGQLSVCQALINIDYEMRFSEPKTPRSRRAIALDQGTIEALREHRKRQLEESRGWGPAWTNTGLVFTREDGLPIHPDRLKKLFERQVASSGLPRVTLHGLRHSHASLALKAGIHPKIVSERLGHSSTALTMDIYSHVLDGMQEAAAGVIGSLIFSPSGSVAPSGAKRAESAASEGKPRGGADESGDG